MFRRSKIILPFVAFILLLFFTSMEAHLFLAQLEDLEEVQQEERETEKEIDELREWKKDESKWTSNGDNDFDFDCPDYYTFFYGLCQDNWVATKPSCQAFDKAHSSLYLLYCALKLDC